MRERLQDMAQIGRTGNGYATHYIVDGRALCGRGGSVVLVNAQAATCLRCRRAAPRR